MYYYKRIKNLIIIWKLLYNRKKKQKKYNNFKKKSICNTKQILAYKLINMIMKIYSKKLRFKGIIIIFI